MAQKHGDIRARIAGGVAATVAGFVARRLIAAAWTRITGKLPPDDPSDPQVAVTEAVGFAVVVGVGMEVARLLATRATLKRLAAVPAQRPGAKPSRSADEHTS